jgi:hypothetical protein
LGFNSKVAYAYLLGPKFALDDMGLALVRTAFGDSPAVVIVRNREDEEVVAKFNQKLTHAGRPPLSQIITARNIGEAESKLRQWIQDLGGTHIGGFTFHGIVNAEESLAVPLKEALKEQVTLMFPHQFRHLAEMAGIMDLIAQLKDELQAKFRLAHSA